MSDLYSRISALCDNKGIKIAKMCTDIGISKGNLTDLKMGRKKVLAPSSLKKIAEYFGVSVDYLLNGESKGEITDDLLMVGLLDGDTDGFTFEMLEEVKRYAKYVRDKVTVRDS